MMNATPQFTFLFVAILGAIFLGALLLLFFLFVARHRMLGVLLVGVLCLFMAVPVLMYWGLARDVSHRAMVREEFLSHATGRAAGVDRASASARSSAHAFPRRGEVDLAVRHSVHNSANGELARGQGGGRDPGAFQSGVIGNGRCRGGSGRDRGFVAGARVARRVVSACCRFRAAAGRHNGGSFLATSLGPGSSPED